MRSRRLLPWLFALALLLGQAAAFAHALTHVRTHEDALPDKVCEVCVAHAQLGNAAPPAPGLLPSPGFTQPAPPAPHTLGARLLPASAQARAPPASV